MQGRIQCLLWIGALLAAQEEPTPDDEAQEEAQARVEEEIDVVGLTPISSVGMDIERFPWSAQQISTSSRSTAEDRNVSRVLDQQMAGVHVDEVQNNPLQPDVYYRGFSTSPLLGAAQGLTVWEDGVRVNEIFGDVVQWDLLPSLAVDSIELLSGAHAAFGPNTLGGALSLRTRDGRAGPRLGLTVAAGSWNAREATVEAGGARHAWSGYLAAERYREDGWRDFSPSEARKVFGKLGFSGDRIAWDLGIGWADNELVGNGTAPIELLEIDRAAVFTHPDITNNRLFFPRMSLQTAIRDDTLLELVGFVRESDISTFNADELDETEGAGPGAAASERGAAVDNRSRTDQIGHGLSGQVTHSRDLGGRENQIAIGAALERGSADFSSSSELARFTADRSSIGTGTFLRDRFVAVDAEVERMSIFLSDSLRATDRLTLNLQTRYDSTRLRLRDRLGTSLDGDHDFSRLNGGAGASLELRRRSRSSLYAFAGLSRSSRNPTPVELTCADPEDPCRLPNAFVADPPLDEVVTTGMEAGVRGRTPALRWSIALFGSENRNDILFISSGRATNAGYFTNVASTQRRGIEASLRGRVGEHTWFAGYTGVKATFGTDLSLPSANHPLAIGGEIDVLNGDTIPGIPRHVLKAGLQFSFGRLALGMTARAQSSRYYRGDEANLLPTVPGLATADLDLSWSFAPRISVGLSVDNLFDAEYETFGVLGDATNVLGEDFQDHRFLSPGAPRSIRLRFALQPFSVGGE